MDNTIKQQKKINKLIRYYILLATTKAGSGHLTSSLSAVEIMSELFFNRFRYDLQDPESHLNDHLVFSKGHASPLFYALFAAAGELSEKEIRSFRDFGSKLEGHPTLRFAHTEAPTGSLGQGLSVGLGIAMNAKYLDNHPCKVYVLLGDGEMAEGQVWEAIQLASYYKLNNLIAIADINRLAQSGETMLGHDIKTYEKRIKAFGWNTYLLEGGHNVAKVKKAYEYAMSKAKTSKKPTMIIARTIKGKGVSFLEDKEGWHGKALSADLYKKALKELGKIDKKLTIGLQKPDWIEVEHLEYETAEEVSFTNYKKPFATRKAYGNALVRLGKKYSDVVVLDADVKNSTYSEKFFEKFPERAFDMFIAEQNMVSAAVGIATVEKVPFVSTFSAFFTRAFDQIRMARIAEEHIVFCGSHAGVSIGEDGSSQMGLEDIAMMRTGINTTVFYPSDAFSTEKITEIAYEQKGIVYIRTTRADTAQIYSKNEKFILGGSKTLKSSSKDVVTVISAGITLHEALKAYKILKKENIRARIIDLYCLKPIDKKTILKAARETKAVVTVEDHYKEGGIGDCVIEVLADQKKTVPVYKMAVDKMPMSGKPEDLLSFEEIDKDAIVQKVKSIV